MFESISIEEHRDAGSCKITYFAIPPGQESAAGRKLLAYLTAGAEVSLSNDVDEAGEGASSFCRSASGFFTRVGGHGWQSEWKPIDEAAFLATVVELACHNRGGPQAQGSITQGMRLAIGPFDPPEDYAFEPEFAAPPPRSITPRVRLSGIERRQIWAIRGTIAFGIVMLLLDQVARAEDWMRAVPPLVYLRWVGAAGFGLGAIGMLVRWLGLGPQRYIRKGAPLVARVVELVKGPSLIMNGQATLCSFTATIEYRDPITGQLQQRSVKSPDFAAGRKDQYGTSFKIGDYLTAVYLPAKYPKSLQLFAFLELVPGLGLVRTPAVSKGKFWKTPLVAVAVVTIFAALFWNLYAFSYYMPVGLRLSYALPFSAGALVTAGLILGGTWTGHRRERRQIAERNALAHARGEAVEVGASSFWGQRGLYGFVIKVLVIPGAFLIGGMTALCWCFSANALLDHSPPVFKAVRIEAVQIGVVRYRLADSQETHEYRTTREKARELALMPAVAEVHAGRFGWPWVKTLRPEAKK